MNRAGIGVASVRAEGVAISAGTAFSLVPTNVLILSDGLRARVHDDALYFRFDLHVYAELVLVHDRSHGRFWLPLTRAEPGLLDGRAVTATNRQPVSTVASLVEILLVELQTSFSATC